MVSPNGLKPVLVSVAPKRASSQCRCPPSPQWHRSRVPAPGAFRTPFIVGIAAALIGCLFLFLINHQTPVWMIAAAVMFFGLPWSNVHLYPGSGLHPSAIGRDRHCLRVATDGDLYRRDYLDQPSRSHVRSARDRPRPASSRHRHGSAEHSSFRRNDLRSNSSARSHRLATYACIELLATGHSQRKPCLAIRGPRAHCGIDSVSSGGESLMPTKQTIKFFPDSVLPIARVTT